MLLTRLVAKNFLSWEELDLRFSPQELIVIEGKNGTGKSSIFEAISFALFGKVFKKATPKGLCHDGKFNKGFYVSLTLTDGDTIYRIARGRREAKPFLSIHKNGKSLATRLMREGQSFIDKLLKINYQIFCLVNYFTSENLWLFQSFSEKEKKTAMLKILGLDFAEDLKRIENKLDDCRRLQFKVQDQLDNVEELKGQVHLKRVNSAKLQEKHVDVAQISQERNYLLLKERELNKILSAVKASNGLLCRRLKHITAMKTKVCPTCLQTISKKNKQRISTRLKKQIQILSKKISKMLKEHEELEHRIYKYQMAIDRARALSNRIRIENKLLNGLRDVLSKEPKLKDELAKRTRLVKLLELLKSTLKPTGFANCLLDDFLKLVNDRLKLTSANFNLKSINLVIEKSKLRLTANGKSFNLLSQGEKTKVSISLLVSLLSSLRQYISSSLEFVLLDEAFINLDTDSKEALKETIKEMAPQVLCISHDKLYLDYTCHLAISKEEGASHALVSRA